MITPKHILGTFDEALASLRNNVLMMSSLTERSLERAMKGLFNRDDDLCAHAIADDEEIDQLEIQIDKDGVAILLRFQPVASDLRRVVSAMKLSSNLERMAHDPEQLRGYLNLIFIGRCFERVGDHATNIAEDAVYAAAAEDIRHQPVVATTWRGQSRRVQLLRNFLSSGCVN